MTVVKTIRIIAFNALCDLYLAKFKVRIVSVTVDITRAKVIPVYCTLVFTSTARVICWHNAKVDTE